MIKNNKISEFLDQYSIELRRMGIYLLIITFIFGLSLKVIGDRTKIAPPENRQANQYIEVDFPDPQIPEEITVIVEPQENIQDTIINEAKESLEQKPIKSNEAIEPQEKVQSTKNQDEINKEVITEGNTEETISLENEIAETEETQGNLPEDVNVNSRPPTLSLTLQMPVKGDIINPYGLTYSKTFGDYRFNPGIDIAAAQGTEVKAALEGKVIKVTTNQREKTIIEIEHNPGVVSRYSHLEQSLVKSGDTVATGQVIGKIGSPGLEKSAEESLLHFQIKNGDKTVDPTEHIK